VSGPLGFVAYINRLPSVLSQGGVRSQFYADDGKCFVSLADSDSSGQLQTAVSAGLVYLRSLQLDLCLSKCFVLHFGHPYPNSVLTVDGTVIKAVPHERDLGVIVDSKLTFRPHYEAVVKRAFSWMHLFRRCFETRDRNFLHEMFEKILVPMLMYVSPVWSPHQQCDTALIERVQ